MGRGQVLRLAASERDVCPSRRFTGEQEAYVSKLDNYRQERSMGADAVARACSLSHRLVRAFASCGGVS